MSDDVKLGVIIVGGIVTFMAICAACISYQAHVKAETMQRCLEANPPAACVIMRFTT